MPTGIEGIGTVSTSSPTAPTTALPSASNASTFAPRHGPAMTPRRTGSSGFGPTNPVHISVPPENDPSTNEQRGRLAVVGAAAWRPRCESDAGGAGAIAA